MEFDKKEFWLRALMVKFHGILILQFHLQVYLNLQCSGKNEFYKYRELQRNHLFFDTVVDVFQRELEAVIVILERAFDIEFGKQERWNHLLSPLKRYLTGF